MTGTPRLDDQLCFAMYAASRATTAAYRPGLARLGLTYPQFITLLVLWERDGVGLAELASRLYLDASTLSPLLKRLESMGLVQRERSRDDERCIHIRLTAAGAALAGPASEVQQEVAERLTLTAAETVQLRSLTQRLIDIYQPDAG